MTMNIAGFRGKLGAGGARPNQFRVTLSYPTTLVGGQPGERSLLVSAASLPGSNVAPTIVQYRGREVPLAGERTFDPWTISVLNDSNMSLRRDFEAWSDGINNRLTNGGELIPSLYMSQLLVEQLDRNDKVIRTYKIIDAFPIQVGEVPLDYSQDNVVSSFQVTFRYQRWDVVPT